MDPISQGALGAAVAHTLFHRRLGFRAASWGALAGVVPDVDVLFSVGGDAFDALVRHRGITHSLFFGPVVGPLWGAWLARRDRLAGRGTSTLAPWIGAITLALLSHPILDYFTFYGTQLLAPFSDQRFALPAVPIIEPIYTLTLLGGIGLAWIMRRGQLTGAATAAALLLSSAYLAYGRYLNVEAETLARQQLAANGITDAEVRAYPTVLRMGTRRLLARRPNSDLVAYIDMANPCELTWQERTRIDSPLIDAVLRTREGRIFEWFASDGWVAEISNEPGHLRLLLADPRFGTDLNLAHSMFAMHAQFDDAGNLIAAPQMTAAGGRSLQTITTCSVRR